ncbi:MAG TPA: MgtC/SapB family protein, partial [Thermoanaerobaculia bacterium]|nr:MgtC/SapB family protein [Thermoanaerobaculia bacterium]
GRRGRRRSQGGSARGFAVESPHAPPPFLQLAVALGLGLLVGLQRERMDSAIAGIRTFALITVLGAVAAQLGEVFGGWVVAVGLLAVAGLVTAGNLARMPQGKADPGQTTEFAALVMYGIGAWVVVGSMAQAVVLGGVVALLLQLREPLHQFAGKIGEKDIKAIMQLVLIALVILPLLPDRAFGPYGVLNPYQVWWMVVLIVGISLLGYVAYKLFGLQAGTVAAGILGGIISSTATTVSYARRTKEDPGISRLAALVVMIASAVTFIRVMAEIAVVAHGSFLVLAPPLAAMFGVMVVLSSAAWLIDRHAAQEPPEPANPAELKSALLFGALYAAVLLASAFARDRFGTAGLYAVAAFSALTDVDAFVLSTSRLVDGRHLAVEDGWRAILLAILVNLVFKAAIVAFLGSRRMLGRVAVLFTAALAAGAVVWWVWP